MIQNARNKSTPQDLLLEYLQIITDLDYTFVIPVLWK